MAFVHQRLLMASRVEGVATESALNAILYILRQCSAAILPSSVDPVLDPMWFSRRDK